MLEDIVYLINKGKFREAELMLQSFIIYTSVRVK